MNHRQKRAFWIGIVVAVAMGLYPPWIHWAEGRGGLSVERPATYGLLVDPPPAPNEVWSTRVDYGRLGIQWAVVLLITGGAVATLAGSDGGGGRDGGDREKSAGS